MTGTLLASAVVLLLSAGPERQAGSVSPSGTGGGQGAVEHELIALDKKFDEARRKGDTAFAADFLTEDFVQVTQTGVVRKKADLLKSLEAQTAKPIPAPPQDAPTPTYTVHVDGETAIMTHVNAPPTDPHDPRPGNAVMHVFLKQQGRWKMAAWSSVTTAPNTEQSINRAGYELMESGKLQDAIELFKLNVRLYPESWNVYDSLGEAQAKAEDTALAIQNYEKSLQLNPKNELGKAALEKLRGK
jgi:tetratricopeptide (TPR) repeat protein